MKRVHRSALALFFALLLVASLVAPSGLANAASIYDNSYQSTATVRTSWAHPNCDPVDITLDWKSYVLDETKWPAGSDYSAMRASLQSALNNGADGAWGVTQFTTEIANIVQVYWTDDPAAYLSWSNQSVDVVAASGENSYSVDIACSNKFYNTGSPAPVVIGAAPFQSLKISTSPSWTMFYRMKSLFVHGFNLNYPAGYEGEAIRTEQPAAKYVAMGDSFSSGEGNPSFEAGTDQDGVNKCHRSSVAYPRLLQNDSSLTLGPVSFVACGGATTANVLDGQWNEPPQVDALSSTTEKVTLTIGGNDIGFREFATACATSLCNFSTIVYDTVVDKIDNELPGKLEDVFDNIAMRVSSLTKIYVIGYPHIAPPTMPTGHSGLCVPLNGQFDNPDPALNDGATVRDVVTRLNDAIDDAVDKASDSRFVFVDPNDVGSPFIGHDWCEQDRYFQIVAYNGLEYSFHPNGSGHSAYKTIVKNALS